MDEIVKILDAQEAAARNILELVAAARRTLDVQIGSPQFMSYLRLHGRIHDADPAAIDGIMDQEDLVTSAGSIVKTLSRIRDLSVHGFGAGKDIAKEDARVLKGCGVILSEEQRDAMEADPYNAWLRFASQRAQCAVHLRWISAAGMRPHIAEHPHLMGRRAMAAAQFVLWCAEAKVGRIVDPACDTGIRATSNLARDVERLAALESLRLDSKRRRMARWTEEENMISVDAAQGIRELYGSRLISDLVSLNGITRTFLQRHDEAMANIGR